MAEAYTILEQSGTWHLADINPEIHDSWEQLDQSANQTFDWLTRLDPTYALEGDRLMRQLWDAVILVLAWRHSPVDGHAVDTWSAINDLNERRCKLAGALNAFALFAGLVLHAAYSASAAIHINAPVDGDRDEFGRVFLAGQWRKLGPMQARLLSWILKHKGSQVEDAVQDLGMNGAGHLAKTLTALKVTLSYMFMEQPRSLMITRGAKKSGVLDYHWQDRPSITLRSAKRI
jgi:hypothetical protein